jgi:hypothetical protein
MPFDLAHMLFQFLTVGFSAILFVFFPLPQEHGSFLPGLAGLIAGDGRRVWEPVS